jgi:hypothetical protein
MERTEIIQILADRAHQKIDDLASEAHDKLARLGGGDDTVPTIEP